MTNTAESCRSAARSSSQEPLAIRLLRRLGWPRRPSSLRPEAMSAHLLRDLGVADRYAPEYPSSVPLGFSLR